LAFITERLKINKTKHNSS